MKYAIPDHQEIESDKQSEEAAKVRNQGAERVGHHLLLSSDDWTVELYAQYRHIWIRGEYHLRVSDQLKNRRKKVCIYKSKARCPPHQLPGIQCMNKALDKNSGPEEIVHPYGL